MKMMFKTETESQIYEFGKAKGVGEVEQKILEAANNGTPINIEGRAWFLKSDIQNLRDLFDDMETESNEKPVQHSFVTLKQLLFDCAANLILTNKPREDVASDILRYVAELDKYKIMEDITYDDK